MYAGLIGTAVHVVLGRGIAIAACTPRTNLLRTAHEGQNYFGRLQSASGTHSAVVPARPWLSAIPPRASSFTKPAVAGSLEALGLGSRIPRTWATVRVKT